MVLAAGSLAFLDSNSLIPCKVLSIKDTADLSLPMRFELCKGGISSRYRATIQITKACFCYRVGEVYETAAYNVVPRKAIRRRKYSTIILAYTVEVSK